MNPTTVLGIIDFLLIATIVIKTYVLVSRKYTGVFYKLVESGGLILFILSLLIDFILSLLIDQFILMCIK